MTNPKAAGPLARLVSKMATVAPRLDAYINWVSGVGSSRDRTTGGSFYQSAPLDWEALRAMYRDDDLARKIVDLLPDEAFRKGFELAHPQLKAEADRLGVVAKALDADRWARLYGGALIFAVTNDSRPADWPRDPRSSVLDFEVWDRRRCWIQEWYSDPTRPNFGKPRIYMIQPFAGFTSQAPITVHESRVVRFPGAKTDPLTVIGNAGWDDSVLQAVEPILRQFAEADGATNLMLSEASQAVFKLNGLIEACTSGQSAAMQARLQLMDMSRSVARAVMLDAGKDANESFERFSVQFGGVADVIRTKMQRLAAASGIPMSKLFSQTPTGLGTDTDNETRSWYDYVGSYQVNRLEPLIKRMLEMIAMGGSTVGLTWRSLYQQAPKEAAETRLLQAQADKIYLDEGVVTEREIALSRFPTSGWSGETHLDPNAVPAWKMPEKVSAAPPPAALPPASTK